MKEKFEVKILPRIVDPDHGGEVSEGTHLHRIIKWNHQGFSWEADPKYAAQLAKDMGTRIATAPGHFGYPGSPFPEYKGQETGTRIRKK